MRSWQESLESKVKSEKWMDENNLKLYEKTFTQLRKVFQLDEANLGGMVDKFEMSDYKQLIELDILITRLTGSDFGNSFSLENISSRVSGTNPDSVGTALLVLEKLRLTLAAESDRESFTFGNKFRISSTIDEKEGKEDHLTGVLFIDLDGLFRSPLEDVIPDGDGDWDGEDWIGGFIEDIRECQSVEELLHDFDNKISFNDISVNGDAVCGSEPARLEELEKHFILVRKAVLNLSDTIEKAWEEKVSETKDEIDSERRDEYDRRNGRW